MKTFLRHLTLLLSFLTSALISFAEAPKMIFENNKNQWPSQVKFQAQIPGGSVFLEKDMFTYAYEEDIDWHGKYGDRHQDVKVKYHAYKMHFENCNPNVEVFGNNKMVGHRNYYRGNDRSKWAENVQLFNQVFYQGLYKNIDVKVYNSEINLKYDFIVNAGGDVKDIKLNYEGTDNMVVENGHLIIKTCIYTLIEQKPYAYQMVEGFEKPVTCSYVLKNNSVTFAVGDYDHSLPLIIDPAVIASTYSGSTAANWGFTATYDAGANIYIGGTASGNGYPTTVGAHDAIFNGGPYYNPFANAVQMNTFPFDISLTKFDATGTNLLWSTYYGGSEMEQPHSIVVNTSNELYVAGRTYSPNFPYTAGAFDNTPNGGADMIIGKFSSTGALLASTCVGGSADDGVNVNRYWDTYVPFGITAYQATKYNYADDGRSEIILDANSNVYVAACTQSTNFLPVGLSPAPYDNTLSGAQDAVVIKMDPNLSTMLFGTYIGGNAYDAGYGLKLDNSGTIYMTGGTTSPDFPIPTAGVIKPTLSGLTDGFIAVFDPTLAGPAQLLRSTYLGTAQYDQAYMIEIDASGDLYVFGQSRGTYPVVNAAFSNANSGQFVHKISGSLTSTIFSTVIGSGQSGGFPIMNISPTAFLVDSCQTIYIAGWGRCSTRHPNPASVSGMPVTANAVQPTTVNGCNFYFAVLEPNATGLFYATYFGQNSASAGDHVDGGTSRFDKRGVIYQSCCANCGKTNPGWPVTVPPTQATPYSATNQCTHINFPLSTNPNYAMNNCNEAVVKMDVSVNPVAVATITGPTSGCAPFVVNFTNTGSVADNYIWDFGDGGTSNSPAPTYTYNFPGTFTITLFGIDSIGICGYIDTSIVVITVGSNPVLAMSSTNFLCNPGTSTATVTVTSGVPGYTYAWSPSGGNSSAISVATPGTYTVSVTDASGCTSTSTVLITQPPPLTITPSTTLATCTFSNGVASATAGGGTPGYSYSWNSTPAQTTATATGLGAGIYNVTVTDANGCTSSQPVTMNVANGPTVTALATGTVNCNGGNTGAANASVVGGTSPYTYQWSPGTGGTSSSATGLLAGTYYIVVTDANGCVGVDSVNLPEPPPILINISVYQPACTGGNNGSTTANVTGGTTPYTYAWTTSPVQTTQTATGLTSGTYTVLVTDSKGCTNTAFVTVTSQPGAMAISATTVGTSCITNSTASITSSVSNGNPAFTYTWMPGGQTTANISNVLAGTYTVVVTDANNCTAVAVATVINSPVPIADFTFTPTISCEGISMQFTDLSTNAVSWSWNAGVAGTSTAQHPSFMFPYNGNYNVTLIATNPPCRDTVTKAIVIGDVGTGMKFSEANVFTPNNDGQNDCFHPSMINIATGKPDEVLLPCTYLQVFDRWGVKMYESIGANGINCWNGYNKNDSKEAKDGTYFWIAKLGETTLHGYVTLARHK